MSVSIDKETMTEMLLIGNALILLANLGVLALSLKLYTEYFKDRSMERRKDDMKGKER